MLFEWVKHRRPITVGFIIIHLTCLDLSRAYSCLLHSRRWDVRLDVFAVIATTFLFQSLQVGVLNWSIWIFWIAKKTPKQKTGVAWPEDKEVVMTPGQPGPRVNLPLVRSLLFSGLLDHVGLACVYQNYLFDWTVTEPTKRRWPCSLPWTRYIWAAYR